VTSDPLSADTDGDGLNDGVEQALGENPRAWTPNPQGLQVEISDADGIVGPEQSLVYTATLENQIDMDPGYFLTGTLTATLPSALGGGVLARGSGQRGGRPGQPGQGLDARRVPHGHLPPGSGSGRTADEHRRYSPCVREHCRVAGRR
jgi:hypothetical protein